MKSREDLPGREGLVDFLLKSSSYPHQPKKLVHLQTHASDVFIVSPYVYKVKKPVEFGFLDFSTLEKRKHYLNEELSLNKRLTEDIYLEVTEISLQSGDYVFGPGDETVEYALIMKELPEKYFLKNLLKEGRVSEEDFDRIATKLAEFYKSEVPDPRISSFGKPDRIKPDIYENIETCRAYVGETVSSYALYAIERYNDMFFERNTELFEKRLQEGFIKDCHGDLHLEHINAAPDGINIYDCIEFNERFRFIDIASDTGFLAMDLDFNGHFGFSRYFISRISELMEDRGLYGLLDFYKCYRAIVRAKVLSIKAFEPEMDKKTKQKCIHKAKSYFRLALRYALLGSRPAIISVMGSIGTGKSNLARTLSEELSCPLLSSDIFRKEISGSHSQKRHYEPYEGGIYSTEKTQEVYSGLIDRAIQIVKTGQCVVLDASFSKKKWRELLNCSSLEQAIPLYFIQTKAPVQTVRERLKKRELEGGSVSDGRLEILERFSEEFEEPEEHPDYELLKIDTSVSKEEKIRKVFERLIRINMETDYEF